MKNFRLSALLCCVSLCGFAACSDDKTDDQPEPQAYQVTQFESSTIPASIPGEGGGYKLTFVIRTETRSTGATFEPWAYRLTLGDAVGDAVTVTKPTTEIAITIPPNRSKEERGVAVEMASGVKAETWTKIVEATQEGSLKDYQVTKFESTTIPATVPAGGGDYDVLFRLEVETRAAAPLFVAWQYRVTLGDAVGDAVEVTEPTEKIGIHIDASESVEERAVIVEMAEVAETPVWTKIVEAKQEAGRKEYEVTEFESTTIPASVPFAGGDYEVKFRTKIETRATPQFEPWQYRLTVGEAVGEPVAVNEPTESVAVHIGANYSEKEVDVIFETAAASQTPVWTKVVEAKQQAGMELLGGFYWTKSNVSVKNDRFVLADKPSDSGLFFRHESGYGVPSDEATYAGTAYTPAPVQIAIDAIPQNEGVDPCSLIDPALRMPTYAELSELYYGEDVQRTQDGVTGMGYTGVSLFLPYCGVMSTETGTSVGKSTFGGYWGLGGDFHGNGVIYSLNGEIGYSLLDYDAVGTNMAMVRCVRNVPQPKYVMHTLPETVDYKAFFAERGDRSGCLHLLRCHRMGRRRHPYADGGYGRPAAGVGGYPEERYEAGPDIAPLRQPYLYRRRIRTARNDRLCALCLPYAGFGRIRSLHAERDLRQRHGFVPRRGQGQRRRRVVGYRFEGESDRRNRHSGEYRRGAHALDLGQRRGYEEDREAGKTGRTAGLLGRMERRVSDRQGRRLCLCGPEGARNVFQV